MAGRVTFQNGNLITPPDTLPLMTSSGCPLLWDKHQNVRGAEDVPVALAIASHTS